MAEIHQSKISTIIDRRFKWKTTQVDKTHKTDSRAWLISA